MRAVLILAVLMAWTACIGGAVLLTAYLVAIGTGAARDRRRGVKRSPSPPPPGVVAALVAFAVFMWAAAAWLAGPGRTGAWAALPVWAALAATITAVVLRRRTKAPRGREPVDPTMSIAEAIAASAGTVHVPVTFERCDHVEGPFFHGTRVTFEVGDLVVAGRDSNYHEGRVANHVYFAALVEPAVWAAELAVALGGTGEPGRVYVVEPTGPFEDDPNVTDKRFPGNVTRSYRTRDPMRVVAEVPTWQPHSEEELQGMLDNIARLREQGLDVIED